jgi:hypothetical protein
VVTLVDDYFFGTSFGGAVQIFVEQRVDDTPCGRQRRSEIRRTLRYVSRGP